MGSFQLSKKDMSFEKEYYKERTIKSRRVLNEKENQKALRDLAVCDKSEIFKFESYVEGCYFLINEQGDRAIEVGYVDLVNTSFANYMTIDDILENGLIQYIRILLLADN